MLKNTLLPIVFLFLSSVVSSEEYVCDQDKPGTSADCIAVFAGPGGIVEVAFRKGDIVDTDRGWVVSNGWTLLDFSEAPVQYPSMIGL